MEEQESAQDARLVVSASTFLFCFRIDWFWVVEELVDISIYLHLFISMIIKNLRYLVVF